MKRITICILLFFISSVLIYSEDKSYGNILLFSNYSKITRPEYKEEILSNITVKYFYEIDKYFTFNPSIQKKLLKKVLPGTYKIYKIEIYNRQTGNTSTNVSMNTTFEVISNETTIFPIKVYIEETSVGSVVTKYQMTFRVLSDADNQICEKYLTKKNLTTASTR